jgi:phosphomannomutase
MNKTLMVSVSGIRGVFGEGLTPEVLVRYSVAFGTWCRARSKLDRPTIVVGRDARVTGPICSQIVMAALNASGCDVIDAGLATTPTVEMGVIEAKAAGGIVLSASHNPAEWNALKLLNEKGEFLSPDEGAEVIRIADANEAVIVGYEEIGSTRTHDYLDYHIEEILKLDFIDASAIARANLKVVVDGVNSVGGIALPALLRRIGIDDKNIIELNCEATGRFAHIPEPLPENLTETIAFVREAGADIGLVVDPDADRLALVADGGHYVSEELTQVIAADFLWQRRKGPFVTNLSSSRAIEDVAARHGQQVHRSAVGEINVVKKMQEVGAVLGGEGNGGVILPDLHHGRDALVGVAMILQHLAETGKSLSEVVSELPRYAMAKNKAPLGDMSPDEALAGIAEKYRNERIDTRDGVKIDFDNGWVHMRKSNTEPIVRIYSEGRTGDEAAELADRFGKELAAA